MRARRFLAALFAVALLPALASGAGATVVPGPLADLQQRLALSSQHAPGHVGVLVEDLSTGLTAGVNPNAEMPAASTIKIPVMVEVFERLRAGDFDLNHAVTLLASDRDWGYGDLSDARPGSRYSVATLLSLMITNSDNTATNMLIRLVGRQNVNGTMERLGLDHTRLADYIRSSGNGIRYALRSSPADMVRLLESMARDRLIDAWSSRAMIAILAGQRHNSLLPEPLPVGTTVAHKTGTLHDTLNDVGIVYLNNNPYVIAVMTTNLPTLDAGRRFIRGVSRLAYDSIGRFAAWRENNGFPSVDTAPVTPDVQMWGGAPASTALPVEADPEANPRAFPAPAASASPAAN